MDVSESTTPNAYARVRTVYLKFQINQQLYINAAVMLIVYLLSSLVLEPKTADGAKYLSLLFWLAAICYDLASGYKKLYKSIIGKGVLLIVLALFTNLAITISSQLVNEITGVDPSKFPHT